MILLCFLVPLNRRWHRPTRWNVYTFCFLLSTFKLTLTLNIKRAQTNCCVEVNELHDNVMCISPMLPLQIDQYKQDAISAEVENGNDRKLTPAKQFTCSRCNKQYITKTGLDRHMQNHTGKFTYYCEKCKKGYNDKKSFQVHLDKHAGVRYHCDVCQKSFCKTQDRDNHMSIHTGVWRMECDVCGKGFNEKRVFERHAKCHW